MLTIELDYYISLSANKGLLAARVNGYFFNSFNSVANVIPPRLIEEGFIIIKAYAQRKLSRTITDAPNVARLTLIYETQRSNTIRSVYFKIVPASNWSLERIATAPEYLYQEVLGTADKDNLTKYIHYMEAQSTKLQGRINV